MVDHVRAVGEADSATVAELLVQLGYAADPVAVRDRVARWTADDSSAAFVWEDEGEVLGVIAVHVCPWFEKEGNWARIVALVVAETTRGRGVGRALMSAAERFARQNGCKAVELTSRNTRTDAHAFYHRLGFTDQNVRSTRFYRELT